MAKKKRKSANDKPQSPPQPRPSQQSVANKSSSNVPRMPKQSAGHDAPGIGLPSTSNQPFFSNSYNAVPPPPSSYYEVPPPPSHSSGSWRTREAAKQAMANFYSPPFESPHIGSQTSHIMDTPIFNPIKPSVSLPVLAKTPGIDARFSSEMNIGTSSAISVSVRTSDCSMEYMQRLRTFVASKTALEETGYILQPLSESAIERKKRCERCGKIISKEKREDGKNKNEGKRQSLLGGSGDKVVDDQQKKGEEDESSSMEDCLSPIGDRGVSLAREDIQSGTLASTPVPKPVVRCKFHGGTIKYKVWSCCRKHVSSDPCQEAEFHLARTYPQGQLESLWKFHPTPSAYTSHQIRPVVAIDCEMGTAKSGDSELIRVTLIDYFSSEILVDKLVYPDVAMEHYNTRFSGVTRQEMENALTLGQCLMGKSKAREAVWRFVGPHTIVVGHSANNDLTAMRWIHTVVVDTFLVESKKKKAKEEKAKEEKAKEEKANEEKANEEKANEEKAKTVARRDGKEREVQEAEQHKEKPKKKVKGSGALSLKTLTRERLRREIQTAGRNGHDSLEDVIATRDLAHWNVLNEVFEGEK